MKFLPKRKRLSALLSLPAWGAWIEIKATFAYYMGCFRKAKPLDMAGNTGKDARNNVERQMAILGDGARVALNVNWRRGGGHAFIAEQIHGKTYFYSPQTNKRYNAQTLFGKRINPEKITMVRLDNLRFSDRIKKAVIPSK